MKIILAGSTGFIGHEVLNQCLNHPSITAVIALSRRELPAEISSSKHASTKLKVVIMEDWLSYPEAVIEELRGAEGCIWSLGKAWMPDLAVARTVSIDYTLAAARAMTSLLEQSNGSHKKFRFIYVSGIVAERDQTKSLWFIQDYRRIRGQVETDLLNHATNHADRFSTVIVRPGFVLSKTTNLKDLIFGLGPSVAVDQFAGVMVQKAIEEGEGRNKDEVLENNDIKGFSLGGNAKAGGD